LKYLIKHKLIVLGAIIGAIGGYLYYHFIGCASGSCAITSKPFNSTVYGALMGALFFNLFQKETIKKELE
jgi:prepilin signal peptidase PulO-like enzyme (type II secretory pathway)